MLLALASQKERKQRWIIHHVLNFILSEFLPSSIHSSCLMQDAKSGRNIRLSKLCFDYGASLDCIFITNLKIRTIFYPFLLISSSVYQNFSLKNPKNHFSTVHQGFPISERSLEALVRFTSSPRIFSSIHRSFSVSKSKIPKK